LITLAARAGRDHQLGRAPKTVRRSSGGLVLAGPEGVRSGPVSLGDVGEDAQLDLAVVGDQEEVPGRRD